MSNRGISWSLLTSGFRRKEELRTAYSLVCKQGVTGSSPVGSTTKNRPTTRPFSTQACTALAASHGIVAELTPI